MRIFNLRLPQFLRQSGQRSRLLLLSLGALGLSLGTLSGCSTIGYYAQSIHGHFSMLSAAKPVDEWIGDTSTDPKLARRLQLSQQIRNYAVSELALPDNASYRRYADLQRPFVVWNVFAAPALSLQLKTWCFPVAGCVSYRGYFDKADAEAAAQQLHAEGYDVQVAGIPAYSTLGYFDDPLLNTFISYPAGELARMIFHELAHQVVYVQNDSTFNESFATAVEEAGVERWLAEPENAQFAASYREFDGRRQQFKALLMHYRQQLDTLYQSDLDNASKLQQKMQLFAQLQTDYAQLKSSWGGFAGYDRFFASGVSNAHLGAIATYTELVPLFKNMLNEATINSGTNQQTLPDHAAYTRFFAAVRELAKQPRDKTLSAAATLSKQQ